ncbi:HAUS augmin-like complex subunit 6 N-terminus-domain-containing protein [Sphaerosporella brunnea]|uniref:HAUS augmin-like complex subunit 6 N-terminus-domain-containing protein n=1 Tax=Sphaerosporella brunnea TaxID=1250544 RepID=A0A5J5EEN8_9PEZI|nr:HAUS augmin-like complex subunit 6 N-terminus-domain-containing protein [Sphaerosporella brunnea]
MKSSPAVSLLLTNLRLLDYDFDAFPINPDVFTSLTNKGKAFEHIIYHLYNTFDPEDCAQKLQGCWPVYEPAQARELRNVTFKWLEDLKKSGRLGGVLVRRTTLDDCCGQRYEELLLALSTMVLRDMIESGGYPGYITSTAYHQATSTQPSPFYLTPLTIAHRYALGSIIETRRQAREKWEMFERLLDEKEAEIAAMRERIPADEEDEEKRLEEPKPKRPKGYEESIRKKWENNWLGDPRWLGIILNGDPESTRDRFLELPFEQALGNQHYFAEGRVAPPPAISLKGLENQVAEQRRRVEEIRRLRELSTTGVSSASPSKAAAQAVGNKGLRVEFTKHQNLHLKDMAEAPRRNKLHRSEYADLLTSLREEMILASAPSQRTQEKTEVPIYCGYDEPEQSAPEDSGTSAELSDGPEVYHVRINLQEGNENENTDEDDGDEDGNHGPHSPSGGFANNLSLSFLSDGQDRHPHLQEEPADLDEMDIDEEEEPQESAYSSTKHSPGFSRQLDMVEPQISASASAFGSYLNSTINSDDEDNCNSVPASSAGQIPRITQQESTPNQPSNPRLRQSSTYDVKDELFAEQLVSTIAGASFSPSPVKARGAAVSHTKGLMPWDQPVEPSSLAGPNGEYEDDLEDSTMDLPHEDSTMELPHEDSTMSLPQDSSFHHGNNSTVLLPPPSPQSDGRESRQSLAPPCERILPTSSTPTEELLASGDYNSVFKSRPKIALSPQFSPAPSFGGPVRGLNINMTEQEIRDADNQSDDDEDEVMEYMSPLKTKIRY